MACCYILIVSLRCPFQIQGSKVFHSLRIEHIDQQTGLKALHVADVIIKLPCSLDKAPETKGSSQSFCELPNRSQIEAKLSGSYN